MFSHAMTIQKSPQVWPHPAHPTACSWAGRWSWHGHRPLDPPQHQGCSKANTVPREQSLGCPCSSRTGKGGGQLTWGMMVRFWRRSWRPIVDISTLSMMIVPSAASSTRKRQLVREDFPAPVRPTTPTCGSRSLDQLTGLKKTGQILSVLFW